MSIEKIRKTIERYSMILPGDSIVAGLSGGPDSVCLFHGLCVLKDKLGIENIYAVHINHGLRGEESDGDEQYSRRLAESLGAEFISFNYDINKIAAQRSMSTEEAGRAVRYEAFEKVRQEKNAQRIAVAHNLNDQAETVIMRIMRGTGIKGLAGIEYVRSDRIVIRPVLDMSRNEIEAYCSENDLKPRIDSTNNQPIYTRNKIRLNLLPMIAENFNPNIVSALVRLGKQAAEDEDFIFKEALKFADSCGDDAGCYKESCESALGDVKDNGQLEELLDVSFMNIRENCWKNNGSDAESQDSRRDGLGNSWEIMKKGSRSGEPRWNRRERSLALSGFDGLHPAVAKRVIMLCAKRTGLEQNMSSVQLEAIVDLAVAGMESKEIDIANGYYARLSYGKLWFLQRNEEHAKITASVQVPYEELTAKGRAIVEAGGTRIYMKLENVDNLITNNKMTDIGDMVTDNKAVSAEVSISDNEAVGAGVSISDNKAVGAGVSISGNKAVGAGVSISDNEAVGAGVSISGNKAVGAGSPMFENKMYGAGNRNFGGEEPDMEGGKSVRLQIDFDKLVDMGQAVFRNKLPGDRIRPRGMKGTKKLQDFFIDRKIPKHLRETMIILACSGRIIAVGKEISAECAKSVGTVRILTIEY